jgi:hypothetical protein
MADNFEEYRLSLTAPAEKLVAITPADSDLAEVTRGLWVGGAGTLVVTGPKGGAVTITSPAGVYHPVRAKRIALASTATEIVGLY